MIVFLRELCHRNVQSMGYSTFSQRALLRAPLWRGKKGLGLEAQQAVMALKLAKGNPVKMAHVFSTRISRMIKIDHLAVLHELQQENEVDLALKVYEQARKEVWYKPNIPLHRDMLKTLARNGRVEQVFKLLKLINEERVELHMIMFLEVIELFIQCSLFDDAIKVFELMKGSECPPNARVYRTIINQLNKHDQFDLSAKLEKELQEYVIKTFGKDSVAPIMGPLPRWGRRQPDNN